MRISYQLVKAFAAAALLAGGASTLGAQTLFPLQQAEIQANNRNLKASLSENEAQRTENMTGLNLANPEVSVSYMWGQPSDVPNKTNVEVSQSFDFATLSGAKKRVATANNAVASAQLEVERQALALEAENLLINYLYQRHLCQELERQLSLLDSLNVYAGKGLQKGSITRLDYNKLELERMSMQNTLAQARSECESLSRDLYALNGGESFPLPENWPAATLPESFDNWVKLNQEANPEMKVLALDVKRNADEVTLRKREGLPEFSLGYVNELVKEGNYHGVALGFSLPLWGNSGRVKSARSMETASRLRLQSAGDDFVTRKRADYERAKLLSETLNNYKTMYQRIQDENMAYLDKALKAGTINMLDYVTEQEDFFEHSLKYLEVLRDYQLARATLYSGNL